MISSMKGCIAHNDLWLWPISSRSFGHNFATKLSKYGTSCRVRHAVRTVLDRFILYLAQIITTMKECLALNGLWSWPISSSSFNCNFAIKLRQYDTSYHVRSATLTIQDGLFPYFSNGILGSGRILRTGRPWSIQFITELAPLLINDKSVEWYQL